MVLKSSLLNETIWKTIAPRKLFHAPSFRHCIQDDTVPPKNKFRINKPKNKFRINKPKNKFRINKQTNIGLQVSRQRTKAQVVCL